MGFRRRNRGAELARAPGSGLMKIIPETRMPPGDGDEKRHELGRAAATSRPYIDRYRAVQCDGGSFLELTQEAITAENGVRQKFAQERDSSEIADPYVGLLPVYLCHDIFKRRELSDAEKAFQRVFPLNSRQTGSAIVSHAEFKENFDIFTEGLLKDLNWDNLFVAGGSVLAALSPLPAQHNGTRQQKRKYFHHEAYTASDVDIFFYGLDENQASEKLKEVYFTICDSFPDPGVQPICFRTQHAVTIVSKFPYRHVQIILRLYKSPSEVLAGFDVDSCSVGYDGSNVWMTPRCHNSVTAQFNTVDMTRRSPTYETRLAKYAGRGFEVVVPALQRDKIDPQIYEIPFEKSKGLAKLLLLEKLGTPEQRILYRQQQRIGRLQPLVVRQGRFYNHIQQELQDAFLQSQIEGSDLCDASDYQTVFLPWGPKWDAEKVRNLVYTKDMLLNANPHDAFGNSSPRHLCFFGTATEVLGNCSSQDTKSGRTEQSNVDEHNDEEKTTQHASGEHFISGPVRWLAVDPGRQSVGSFHPITEGEWAEGVHLSKCAGRLLEIAQDSSLSVEAAASALASISPVVDSATVNRRDAAGRTPLMLAVLSGNGAAAAAFIDRGALLNSRLGDGRTALHLAAQYGKRVVMEVLLKRGKVLNKTLDEHLKTIEEEERAIARAQVKEDSMLTELREEEGSGEYFRKLYHLKKQRASEARQRSIAREERGYLDKLEVDGVDYDQKMTPLMYAVFFGHIEEACTLLDAQADVTKMLTFERDGSPTAKHAMLTLACHNGHVGVVQMLLERRAPAHSVDTKGRTPLHHAAQWGEEACVQALLAPQRAERGETGAAESLPTQHLSDPDATDREGQTALMLAVSEGHDKIVESLLACTGRDGALKAKTSPANVSLVAIAVKAHRPVVLATLLRHSGDPNTRIDQTERGLFGKAWKSHGVATAPTLLDFVENKLELLKQRGGAEQMKRQQSSVHEHVTPIEYFDFLISKTTGAYELVALTELKFRAEEAVKAMQKQEQGAGGKKGLFQSTESTNASNDESTREKLTAMLETLKAHNAKRKSELDAEERQVVPGKKAPKKKNASASGFGFKSVGLFGSSFSPATPFGSSCSPASPSAAFQLGVAVVPGHHTSIPNLSYSERFEALCLPNDASLVSLDTEVAQEHMQSRYKLLFDAVVSDDVPAVLALCEHSREAVGACSAKNSASGEGGVASDGTVESPPAMLLVAVKSTMLDLSLLQLAMLQESQEMVRCILRLGAKQYTPATVEVETELELTEDVMIKDTQLVELGAQHSVFSEFAEKSGGALQQLSESQSFRRKGHKMLERLAEYKAEEEGGQAEQRQLISVCSVAKLVAGGSNNAFTLGVKRSRYAAVDALLDELAALDIVAEEDDQSRIASGVPPPLLKSTLLQGKTFSDGFNSFSKCFNSPSTAFETAISRDDVRMAELLLTHGARDCLRGADGVALPVVYTGLAVGGKQREDWALPKRLVTSREAMRLERFRALDIAAAGGCDASVEFLLTGGLDAFAVVGDPVEGADPTNEESFVMSSLFSVADRNSSGHTAFNYAVAMQQVGTLRKLLLMGQVQMGEALPKLLNEVCQDHKTGIFSSQWRTPLHEATEGGNSQCVAALLEFRASTMVHEQNGRTPLHMAVLLPEGADPREGPRKASVISELLKAALSEDALGKLLQSLDANGESPLHVAVSHQSSVGLEAILQSFISLPPNERTQVINAKSKPSLKTALHIAVTHKGPKRFKAVRCLLDNGANSSIVDGGGSSALHLAAKANAGVDILELLVSAGDGGGSEGVGVEDVVGRTPLEWLMASRLSSLAVEQPSRGGAKSQQRGQDAIEFLSRNESGGRRMVAAETVRAHVERETAATGTRM
eukprot:TRINITY_DN37814_c0_g1_i1.p1 TRINITY_DN37814_c0_g1~~TRINITY_DN37814_c0_g1_i1.p1  ORF type:complete len:1871 (-),score=397.34 TRINITY_DN37814_c0_g1_i1:75-5687(-)